MWRALTLALAAGGLAACSLAMAPDDPVPPGGFGGTTTTGSSTAGTGGSTTGTGSGTTTGSGSGSGSGTTTGSGSSTGTAAGGSGGCGGTLVDCGNGCIDPDTDSDHCGASGDCQGANAGEHCGVDTPAGDTCVSGVCVGDRELIVNGDFSNGMASWSTANNPVNGMDTSCVFVVISEHAENEPSYGPSAKIMTQDFTVPTDLSDAALSLTFYQEPPDLLDPQNVLQIETGLGNAFRIDFIDPSADHFYAPILYEAYTPTGSVGSSGNPAPVTIDDAGLLAFLQSYEGQPLRLRFGQVESGFPWQFQIDDVSLLVVGH